MWDWRSILGTSEVIAVVLAPVVLVWNLVVFNVIIVPLLLLAFMRRPQTPAAVSSTR